MADIADFANDLVQERIDQALAARNASKSRAVVHSFLFCEKCDVPIPEPRRIAQPGCTCCVECQSMDDHKRARYAR
ncbi:conjugal transfer protein TraR [Pseudomonas sp. FW300-N1A1]|uniref:TraR/DksA family transcriptional regulator n=1 Tax=Pseudomonas sp. FW300-N1A1 TaxID=2075555 RepID=UPI000CD2EA5B|nr:TraR/DksA family transcriptional regulator [Pseudomonas sp. FW300-N1A1]POA21652.1 conjugal transfer protein TraR [Pseudomonas sp. FW300-N1A1]